jgi:uncharacterized protein YbjQ (UPF0145 family)
VTDYSRIARLAARPAQPTAAQKPVGAALSGSSELLALAHAALHPNAVVSGTAVSRIATGLMSSNRLGEIVSLTSAMEAAREQAVIRLIAAAREYRAAGVVGVSPRMSWHGHRRHHTLELTLVGTAVTTSESAAPDSEQVFTATLDGVAMARLIWSGWRPVGLALGVTVFGFPRRRLGAWFRSNWHGGEAALQTSALYAAREVALRRLQDNASALAADGLLGIDVRHDQHVWGRRAIELSAIGTAVARTSHAEAMQAPLRTLSVTDAGTARPTHLR